MNWCLYKYRHLVENAVAGVRCMKFHQQSSTGPNISQTNPSRTTYDVLHDDDHCDSHYSHVGHGTVGLDIQALNGVTAEVVGWLVYWIQRLNAQ